MRVALLVDEGTEKYSLSFVVKAIEEVVGGEVFIVKPASTTSRQGNVITINSSILRRRPEYSIALFNFKKVREVIKGLEVDVIHTLSNSTIGIAAFKVGEELGIRRVATITHLPFTVESSIVAVIDELSFHYLEWFYNNFDALWLPTKGVKGFKLQPVTYSFPPVHLGLSEKRGRKKKVGVYAGKHSHTRELKPLVESLPAIENVVGLSFAFYGEGELKGALTDIRELYKINLRLHDYVPFKELEGIYAKAKVAIMPKTNETITLMPMEAAFYSTPAFVHASSPIAKWLPEESHYNSYRDLPALLREKWKELEAIAEEQRTALEKAEEEFARGLRMLYEG